MSTSDEAGLSRSGMNPTGKGSAFTLAIDALWIFWIATLPLGHATGLHNTLGVIVPVCVIAATRGRALAHLPALPWLVALCALASLSILWSKEPGISAGKLRTDLLLPLVAYTAAYLYSRAGRANALLIGFAAGIVLLALFSSAAFLPPAVTHTTPIAAADTVAAAEAFSDRYPGPGDASTYAILAIAPLIVWRMLRGHWRVTSALLLVLATGLVIFVSRNRNAVIVLPLALAAFALLWHRKTTAASDLPRRRQVAILTTAALACAAIGLFAVEKASQARLALEGKVLPFGSATLFLVSIDPRPAMWSEYAHLGTQHPWLGVGFGRTVPASTYDVRDDPVMKSAMATGFQHAHNVFLNCWLQLGACGLLLYMASLVALVRAAWRARREDAVMRLGGVGALTLLFAMLMRNMTDDFFVYGIASSFWIALGALLGLAAQDPPEIHRSA